MTVDGGIDREGLDLFATLIEMAECEAHIKKINDYLAGSKNYKATR